MIFIARISIEFGEKKKKQIILEINQILLKLEEKIIKYSEFDISFLLSTVSIAESWNENLTDFNLLSFVNCLVKSELFIQALYFLKYYIDLWYFYFLILIQF